MRAFLIAGVAVVLVSAASLASAQQPSTSTPSAEGAEEGRSAGVQSKRQACRRDGQAKGDRGAELRDYVAVCVAEARLACLKQAVEQKVRGQARREFIGKCLSA